LCNRTCFLTRHVRALGHPEEYSDGGARHPGQCCGRARCAGAVHGLRFKLLSFAGS
jgi:hypothetical protein